jgi:hypothetical protein
MKVSKNTTSQSASLPGFEGRYEEAEGYMIGFESFSEDLDGTELYRGLPDDRCQCTHWGLVLSGQMTFRYADGEDVVEAGEAYVARPGHVGLAKAGTEVVEFSPVEEYQRTMEVVARNLQAAEAAS